MNTNQTIYLGIDINGKRRPYTYAALDEQRKLIALGQGPLEEVLFFAAGKNEAIAAVNSPSALNQGLLEIEIANQADHPLHTNGRKHAMRMAEFELLEQGCRVPQTPASSELCPDWMLRGFSLYEALEQVGFRPFSTEANPRQWIETNAEAAYFRLSGQQPLDAHRLEGSLQRQAILYDLDMPVTDPMAFFEEVTRFRLKKGILPLKSIQTPGELNALMAAYLAWSAINQPQQVERLGRAQEGLMYLPFALEKPAPLPINSYEEETE